MRKIANDLCCTLGNYSFSYPFTPGDPDAAAAEAAVVPVETAIIPYDVRFLPQYMLCRDLVWQAWVLQGPAMRPTPAIPTNAG